MDSESKKSLDITNLAKDKHLFTFLAEKTDATELKRTTNSLEGGINSPIKKLMYDHRGLRDEHQRIACDWWLYLHTQLPDDPVEIARQQNWGKDALAKATILANQEKQATNGHDVRFSNCKHRRSQTRKGL